MHIDGARAMAVRGASEITRASAERLAGPGAGVAIVDRHGETPSSAVFLPRVGP